MKSVVKAFLLAGTADIILALSKFYLETGNNPVRVLHFIASGVLGNKAFEGGFLPAATGLIFHYIVTFGWTFAFYKCYPFLPDFKKYKFITGIIFAIIIWLVMNLVVLPLSLTPPIPFNALQMMYGMIILMVAVGIPVSFIIGKYYEKHES
jgi:hypothetical protein